jgi:hypothetical protein
LNAERKASLAALRVLKAFDRRWESYLEFQKVHAVGIFKPSSRRSQFEPDAGHVGHLRMS